MRPYRTLVFARLVQESALTVGGNAPHQMADLPLARDGHGRAVLRGSTLAGCFIATARRICRELPHAITLGGVRAQSERKDTQTEKSSIPSSWRFAHAHVIGRERPTIFMQHVAIDAQTGAAKDDHVFNLEALPPGTEWAFQMEIAPPPGSVVDADFGDVEALAAATLAVWRSPGGARLGRGSRHGYGWCHLEDIVIVRLTTEQAGLWPNALGPERSPEEWADFFRAQGASVLNLDAFLALCGTRLSPSAYYVAELWGTIRAGERQDSFGCGYGVDTLSLGGHAALHRLASRLHPHVLWPKNWQPSEFEPDFVIASIVYPDESIVPFVPGASIRGVWRAALERHARAQQKELELKRLFGDTDQAGVLFVADAYPEEQTSWRLLWQQHVAIDELSGGAYESSKFDRLALVDTSLRWRAVVEAGSADDAQVHAQMIATLIERLGEGHLPLGGGVYRGHGHVRWTLEGRRIRPLFEVPHVP